jgi:hypothetical protein
MVMNGYDIQAATEVAIRLAGVARRANLFGHDRERIIDEILFLVEDYTKLAARIELQMEKEAA